jgi:iron complex transport system permease protein
VPLRWFVPAASLALVGLGMWSLCTGAPTLNPGQVIDLARRDDGSIAHVVLVELRIPRLILATVGGATLGVAGAALQPALQNPLAGPELTGVAAGASLAIAAITVLDIDLPATATPLVAAAIGLTAGLVVITMTRAVADPVRMALAGVAMAAILNALLIGVLPLGTASDATALYQFLVGSLIDRRWHQVRVALPAMLIGSLVLAAAAAPINALRLGDAGATSIGARPVQVRVLTLAAAALGTAGVVAAAGPIGFVALAVPHGVRRLLGDHDVRRIIAASALAGAVTLVAADLLARRVVAPRELPVGLFTVLFGAPVAIAVGRARTGDAAR